MVPEFPKAMDVFENYIGRCSLFNNLFAIIIPWHRNKELFYIKSQIINHYFDKQSQLLVNRIACPWRYHFQCYHQRLFWPFRVTDTHPWRLLQRRWLGTSAPIPASLSCAPLTTKYFNFDVSKCLHVSFWKYTSYKVTVVLKIHLS